MKICWDNLEGIKLNSKGNLDKNGTIYIEKDTCKWCGKSYLTQISNPSEFCCTHHAKRINLVDNKYGRWTVIAYAYNKNRKTFWICECECGTIRPILAGNLKNGISTSCGCYKAEVSKQNLKLAVRWGKDHHRYNPDLTEKDRIRQRNIPGRDKWRESVYERDNYACQKCGDDKGGNLNAHHILSYRANPEFRTTVSNGITLCKECHLDFHHQYGYGDNTRAQLIEFLRSN